MIFKEEHLEGEYLRLSIWMHLLANAFEKASMDVCGVPVVVTRILGKVEGDSGVHANFRGIDFRDEFNGTNLYTDTERELILEYMNSSFPRNDGKLTLINHSFNGGPRHWHLQGASTPMAYSQMFQVRG